MTIRYLSKHFAVAPQLAAADLAALHEAGIAALICNRPDGEGPEQPTFAEIEVEARKYGIAVRYLPVEPGKITQDDVDAFAGLLAQLPGPVLGYCRTGNRSETLWSLAQASGGNPSV
jgi:sulfide:quinone oxidoreductase